MQKLGALLAIILWPAGIVAAPSEHGWNTGMFRISCLEQPFLRISAFTLRWKGVPQVDIHLTDPLGRTAGSGNHQLKLPRTRYGETAEIFRRPSTTKALHLEVCNAPAGQYVLKITEYGSKEYFLSVGGDDGKVARLGPTLSFQANPGRTCEYRFRLFLKNSGIAVRWLDSEGRVLPTRERPACRPILKA